MCPMIWDPHAEGVTQTAAARFHRALRPGQPRERTGMDWETWHRWSKLSVATLFSGSLRIST